MARSQAYKPEATEVRDVPFLKNDMHESVPTTGKPIDTADAPGKADSEMIESDELPAAHTP